MYRKNSNGKISEEDACGLNEFLPVLKNSKFEGNKLGHLGYTPLFQEDLNYCIEALKKEHGVNNISNLSININTVDFQIVGRKKPINKSHAFISLGKPQEADLKNSLFFDSNVDNSFAVTKAGCNKNNAINVVNIQGQYNSCFYWSICVVNEILMSTKKGTFKNDLSNGTLHKNALKRFQYIQYCAENNLTIDKFTTDINELTTGLNIDESKYVGDIEIIVHKNLDYLLRNFNKK